MDKSINNKMAIAGFLALANLLAFIYLSFSSEVDMLAQRQSTISIKHATALPLVNSVGSSESGIKL